jgi:hypothetical protein
MYEVLLFLVIAAIIWFLGQILDTLKRIEKKGAEVNEKKVLAEVTEKGGLLRLFENVFDELKAGKTVQGKDSPSSPLKIEKDDKHIFIDFCNKDPSEMILTLEEDQLVDLGDKIIKDLHRKEKAPRFKRHSYSRIESRISKTTWVNFVETLEEAREIFKTLYREDSSVAGVFYDENKNTEELFLREVDENILDAISEIKKAIKKEELFPREVDEDLLGAISEIKKVVKK